MRTPLPAIRRNPGTGRLDSLSVADPYCPEVSPVKHGGFPRGVPEGQNGGPFRDGGSAGRQNRCHSGDGGVPYGSSPFHNGDGGVPNNSMAVHNGDGGATGQVDTYFGDGGTPHSLAASPNGDGDATGQVDTNFGDGGTPHSLAASPNGDGGATGRTGRTSHPTPRPRPTRSLLARACSLVLLFLLLPVLLGADRIILRNGDVVNGRILRQDSKTVYVRTSFGTVPVAKTTIRTIMYTSKKKKQERINIYLKGGKALRGVIVRQDVSTITLRTKQGIRRVRKKNLEKVDWKDYFSFTPSLRSPFEYAWRSALLPSWGQFYQGKPLKGWITAGVMVGLVTWTTLSYFDWHAANDDYMGYPTQSRYDRVESSRQRFNTLLVITSAAWIWNILDAALFPPGDGGTGRTKTALRLEAAPGLDGLTLTWNSRF